VTVPRSCLACNGWTALDIVEAIYNEDDFATLPVLADALEESGCTDETLLAHCRQGGAHVRGCWAVDAVLGQGSLTQADARPSPPLLIGG
jgi:hypothetical protein